jgi:hypothetical protein
MSASTTLSQTTAPTLSADKERDSPFAQQIQCHQIVGEACGLSLNLSTRGSPHVTAQRWRFCFEAKHCYNVEQNKSTILHAVSQFQYCKKTANQLRLFLPGWL